MEDCCLLLFGVTSIVGLPIHTHAYTQILEVDGINGEIREM